MSSSASEVRSGGIISNIRSNNATSHLKTFAFAIAIIAGCVGLVMGLVGLGCYLQAGILSIKSFALMTAGSFGILLLITGITCTLRDCWQKSHQSSSEVVDSSDAGEGAAAPLQHENRHVSFYKSSSEDSSDQEVNNAPAPIQPDAQAFFQTRVGAPAVIEFIPKSEISEDIARQHILSCLTPEELGNICRVSKSWNVLASTPMLWEAFDFKTLFPSLQICDEQAWNKLADDYETNFELPFLKDFLKSGSLCFDDLKPIDKRAMISELKKFSSLPIRNDAGFTLLTIPKGLSLHKLVQIDDERKYHPFISFDQQINIEYKAKATDKSYRVLISNDLLIESFCRGFKRQPAFVKGHACQLPSALDVSTFALFLCSKGGGYVYVPQTYTICSDSVDGTIVVGGHNSDGLFIELETKDEFSSYSCGLVGAAALQKFS